MTQPTPTPTDYRDLHRLAFQALFQLDAHAQRTPSPAAARGSGPRLDPYNPDQGLLLDALAAEAGPDPARLHEAFALAQRAYAQRADADAAMLKLAPTWPAHRQAAVDRAILRLAHHALINHLAPGKAVINHAVALAKEFSTDKSPAFINALLDKVYKATAPEATPGAALEGAPAAVTPAITRLAHTEPLDLPPPP